MAFTATGSDSDLPAQTLTFSLEDGTDTVPAGAAITAGGDFTWTPTEAQGGATYSFKIRVTDSGTPNLFDEEEIVFTIADTNANPTLDPVGAQAVDEAVLLAFTATGSDSDVPAQTLTFSLEDGTDTVPAGAAITGGGDFTWTPSETQGGATYSFKIRVTDNGTGTLFDEEEIVFTINETNTAPTLDPVGPQAIDENTLLSFTATASDSDVPADTLTFSLEDGTDTVPAGAGITAGGDFAWTPTEAQGGAAYSFKIRVTDNGTGTLFDEEEIVFTVADTNVAPVLDPVGAQAVDETVLLAFTATGSDSDVPAQTLTFSLEDGTDTVPAGAAITAGGDFTWTPTEAQGGAAYTFKVRVTDDGTGTLFDEEEIVFTVADTNVAPVLDPVGAQAVDETVLLAFTATGSDSDVPAQTLTFSLDDGTDTVPAGAAITAGGDFTWTPTEAQGGAAYSFKIRVTDNGTGTLFDEEEIVFTIADTNAAPTLDPVGAQAVDETVLLAFTATASDSDVPADTLTFSLEDGTDTVPAGAAITAGGDFTWTLTEAQGGAAYSFKIRVTDNGSGTLFDEEEIVFTINETNTAPTLDPVGPQAIDENTLLSFTATASDTDNQPTH